MNNGIEKAIKIAPNILNVRKDNQKTNLYHMPYQASCGKLGADIFMLKNKTHLCIVDYHSKFLVVK